MSDELPPGWTLTALRPLIRTRSGDSKLIKGKLPSAPAAGLFPAFSASGQDVWVTEAAFEGRAIIVSAVGARCGKCFKADGHWSAIANTHILWPDERLVNRDFLWWRVNDENFWKRGGSAQPFVKIGDTLEDQFPLPPLTEQRRIVARIEALFARTRRARADLERIAPLAERYRKQVIAAVFQHDSAKHWPMCKLGQICAEARIGLVRSKSEQTDDGGWPYIRMQHYDSYGRWHLEKLTHVAASPAEVTQYALLPGDLLFNTRNSVELVGKVAVWPKDRPGHLYNNNILRLRFVDQIAPEYVRWALMGSRAADTLNSAKSATTSVAAIYQRDLMNVELPVPSPSAQVLITSHLSRAIDAADIASLQAVRALALLDRLEQSTLTRAFRGELVPQDPNDEPASILLERIKAGGEAEDEKLTRKRRQQPNRSKENSMKDKPVPARDQLLKDSEKWPKTGLPFEAIAKRNFMPHDTLRDALFELLSGPSPALQQRFDSEAEAMVIQRVAA